MIASRLSTKLLHFSDKVFKKRAVDNFLAAVTMIGGKRSYRPNEDLPNCVTGAAPSHSNPSKKQATGRGTMKIALSTV